MNDLAERLIRLEDDLNRDGDFFHLGSLNVEYFRFLFKHGNTKVSFVVEAIRTIKFVLKFFCSSKKASSFPLNLTIVFCKSGERPHHNKLIDYLDEEYLNSSKFDKNYNDAFRSLSISEKIIVFGESMRTFVKSYRKIRKTSFQYGLSFHSGKLIYQLVVQYIRFNASKFFFKKKQVKLVLADYDRGVFSALILAANALNIKTVSLQHGVVNPPYGYNPIIADEIWVWGKIWKDILINLKVDESRIKIVGSSIIEDSSGGSFSGEVRVIGIGPNPVGNDVNFMLWNTLISKFLEMNFEVIVKLHPSMKVDADIKKIFGNSVQIFEATQLSNDEFFQMIDLLVVSNSGLGYEAIVNNTLVAVNRQVGSDGNDYIMLEAGKFPELTESVLKKTLEDIQSNFIDYLLLEKRFVADNIFYKTGDHARETTKELINRCLYEMVD